MYEVSTDNDISYYALKLTTYILIYSVSGDTGVQTIIGRAWEDTPLQIYCSFEVAAFVRTWIIGQDVHQILTGLSANLTNLGKVSHQPLYYFHSDANVVVSHVEYYKNMDDTIWYQSVNGRDLRWMISSVISLWIETRFPIEGLIYESLIIKSKICWCIVKLMICICSNQLFLLIDITMECQVYNDLSHEERIRSRRHLAVSYPEHLQ